MAPARRGEEGGTRSSATPYGRPYRHPTATDSPSITERPPRRSSPHCSLRRDPAARTRGHSRRRAVDSPAAATWPVPGRKTDVKDSEWICQLVQHGLVPPSFVPPPEIRRLRDLTRLRAAQTNERARSIQRLEKVLQDAGIKLSSVASHTYSKSARAMLEALLSGVTDPEQLAELAKARMRLKIPQLREALQSRFTIEHHGVMVAQLLAHIDTLDAAIENLNQRIGLVLAPHAKLVELLCTIPGVQTHAAQVLIAECGLDMTVFPTVGHFASWGMPRSSPISRTTAIGPHSPRTHLAHLPADRMRTRRRPSQRHLARRPLRTATRQTR